MAGKPGPDGASAAFLIATKVLPCLRNTRPEGNGAGLAPARQWEVRPMSRPFGPEPETNRTGGEPTGPSPSVRLQSPAARRTSSCNSRAVWTSASSASSCPAPRISSRIFVAIM